MGIFTARGLPRSRVHFFAMFASPGSGESWLCRWCCCEFKHCIEETWMCISMANWTTICKYICVCIAIYLYRRGTHGWVFANCWNVCLFWFGNIGMEPYTQMPLIICQIPPVIWQISTTCKPKKPEKQKKTTKNKQKKQINHKDKQYFWPQGRWMFSGVTGLFFFVALVCVL